MASEYNTDPGQGYRIPRRKPKPTYKAPIGPPAPGRTVAGPFPTQKAVYRASTPSGKRKIRVKARAKAHRVHRRKEARSDAKRRRTIGAYAMLANRATGGREGHLNPLISSMLSTLYADPTHTDWARFKPDVHRLLKDLGKRDVKVIANEDEPGSSAHSFRSHPASWFDPESYEGYATASPRSFRKDRQANALSTALHEFAHTQQKGGRMPDWRAEGGADYWGKRLAKKGGVDYYAAPSYKKYRVAYRRWLKAQRAIRGER